MGMKYTITLFDYEDNKQSEHGYDDERKARRKYNDCVTSAECANVGRIKLYERCEPKTGFLSPAMRWNWIVLAEWYDNERPEPEPEDQLAGYIVHSVRTFNGKTNCKPLPRSSEDFHGTESQAIAQAKHLAHKWSDSHEGLIVFKAVKHVHKSGEFRHRGGVVVDDIE